MASQKIRIKLKAYDHVLLDLACAKIIDTANKKIVARDHIISIATIFFLFRLSPQNSLTV